MMMSFPDTVSRLLRTLLLSLHAIGSTNRTHEAGGGGSSGADFFAAGLELQPWTRVPAISPTTPTTAPTTRKSHICATVAARRADQRNCHELRFPEPPRPALVRPSRVGPLAKASPISRASSFESDVSAPSSQASGGTSDTSETREERAPGPRWNAAQYRKAVRKKQQASELCWREYWG